MEPAPEPSEPPRSEATAVPAVPPAPSGELDALPGLVLQGTALLEDRPVAVVNYQRVFEGDIIEGARVIKILDRAIEVEFMGKRYTLRF